MSHKTHLLTPTLFAGALIAATLAAPAAFAQAPAPGPKSLPSGQCFDSRDWRGWKSPSPDVLYIRVRLNDVYRIDLASGGRRLNAPGDFLVSVARGSSRVCGVIDLDLKVSDQIGPPIALFPVGISKLTPEQAKALPKDAKP